MPEIQKSAIRNIIFDLGGVLLNINPLLSLLEFEKLCGITQEELKNRLASEHIFEKFDTGSLGASQFRNELCRIMDCTLADEQIDHAWNTLLLNFPAHRVNLLRQLRKNYRIYLLSNTNSIHFEHYTREFFETYGIPMSELFDKLFLSYEIGMHKPDTGIYSYVLQHAGLVPAECVFIDDSLPNIEAASALGLSVIHIYGDDVTEYFADGLLRNYAPGLKG